MKERVIHAAEQGLSVEQARISVSKSHANSVFRAYAGDAAVFAGQPMRRAVCLSQAWRIWHSTKREEVFFLNTPVTILRSGELCDKFTDQLPRDLIAKETTERLGIFCYLASLFRSGSVAVSGLR